jgi:predicted DNA-binding protein (MmcQ/YjbR family)
MDKKTLDAICLGCQGASVTEKEQWDARLCLVAGKMFVMHGHDKEGHEIITVKLPPGQGDAMRRLFEGIGPGYHMNKTHWNSIRNDGSVPDDIIADLVRTSYRTVMEGLPQKVRMMLSDR